MKRILWCLALFVVMMFPANLFSQSWKTVDITDEVDDVITRWLYLEASSGLASNGESPYLVFVCDNKKHKVRVFISWHDFLSIGRYGEFVNTRMDDDGANVELWDTPEPRHNTTWYRHNAKEFILKLLPVNQFVARVNPYSNPQITAIFDLTEFNEAVIPFREFCKF